MKILLLGKNGQVGWELQRSLAPLGEVLALDRNSTSHCGDLSNLEGLAETVRVFACMRRHGCLVGSLLNRLCV
jgi:dTDP-4-dehydrorhamnose reductase